MEKIIWKFIWLYADTESLLEKIDKRHNDPEKSLPTKVNKHTDSNGNKHDYYRSRDCMKNFFDLKEHVMKD